MTEAARPRHEHAGQARPRSPPTLRHAARRPTRHLTTADASDDRPIGTSISAPATTIRRHIRSATRNDAGAVEPRRRPWRSRQSSRATTRARDERAGDAVRRMPVRTGSASHSAFRARSRRPVGARASSPSAPTRPAAPARGHRSRRATPVPRRCRPMTCTPRRGPRPVPTQLERGHVVLPQRAASERTARSTGAVSGDASVESTPIMAASVHLHDAQARPLPPARPPGARRHQPVLLSPAPRSACSGANGSGKVVAAADHGRRGRRLHGRGPPHARVHRRPPATRSRRSTRPRTSSATSWTASARPRASSPGTTRSAATFAEPDADFEKLVAEQAELEDEDRRANAWDLERNVEIAMDALRCPPGDTDVTTLSGGERRRVALCRLLLSAARPAAARRAHQPPRRRVGRVARAVPAGLPRHRRRRHPRSVLPRQRRRLDPRARPGRGIPFEGNYSGWLEQKQARLAAEEKDDIAPARRSSASSSGCGCRRRPARRRARPASAPTRSCSPRRRPPTGVGDRLEISIPPGDRLGDTVIEVDGI